MKQSQIYASADVHTLQLFMGMFAHEVKGQLAGLTALARYTLQTGKDTMENLPIIAAGIDRSIQVLDNLLRVIKAHAGALTLTPRKESFLLPELLAEILPPLEAEGRFTGKTFRLQIHPALHRHPVVTDKLLLTQILYNLLLNALKWSLRDRQIVIGCQPDGDMLCITVENTGQTIPAGKLQRLFEPFYQAETGFAGTGLGLYISRLYAEQLGGSIAVESKDGVTRFGVRVLGLANFII